MFGYCAIEFRFEYNILFEFSQLNCVELCITNLQGVIAFFSNELDGAFSFGMDHDLMSNHSIFRYGTVDITARNVTTDLIENRMRIHGRTAQSLTRIFADGVKVHVFVRPKAGTLIPRGM